MGCEGGNPTPSSQLCAEHFRPASPTTKGNRHVSPTSVPRIPPLYVSPPAHSPPSQTNSPPDIDPEPTPQALAAARALISAEQATFSPPSQSPPPDTAPAPTPSAALDLTRYEAQEPPAAIPQETLAAAYTSSTYLASRTSHLALLDAHGKNAWLTGNYQLEAELRALEAELAATKADVDRVNIERKARQDEVGGEMEGLERDWRRGVGRVLETEVAVEELRSQIRDELRAKAAREAEGKQAER